MIPALFLCFTATVFADQDYELRTWSDKAGRYSIEARYVRHNDEVVVLLTEDGDEVEAPIDQLSGRDQRYLEELSRKPPTETIGESQSVFRSYTELIKGRDRMRTAAEVVNAYRDFIGDPSIDEESRERVRKQLQTWEERASLSKFRYGTQWVSAGQKARMQSEAEELWSRANSFRRANDLENYSETLKRISSVDVGAIDADFELGLLWALVGKDASQAKKHFENVCRRLELYDSPRDGFMAHNHAVALSNLALVEMRLDETTDAVQHIQKALRIAPDSPEVNHNIQRAVRLGTNNSLFFVPDVTRDRLVDLARSNRSDQKDLVPDKGWLYLPMYQPDCTSNDLGGSQNDERDVSPIAHGTAVVISPGILALNKSLVLGVQTFDVRLHDGKVEEAELIASHPEYDLALAKIDHLRLPVVKLANEDASQTPVGQVGFSARDSETEDRLMTQGVYTEDEEGHHVIFDALATTDAAIGPLFDRNGEVVGLTSRVVNATSPEHIKSVVPSSVLNDFVRQNVPDFRDAGQANAVEWNDLADDVEESIVQVRVFARPSTTSYVSTSGFDEPFIEDTWCMVCNGHDAIVCTARVCNGGATTVKEPYVVQTNRGPITMYRTKRVECPTCSGRGTVACPNPACNGGRDIEN